MILAATTHEIASTDVASANQARSKTSIVGYIAALATELRRAVSANAAYEDLNRRSDAALSDLGLGRSTIAREIHTTHYID
ncbi:MAG TPA: hypothetical protein PK264_03480 [Hyphomicrobiaceae bacterium]|nr:hypothetical protein [Hyphomicrobiaceae bacterium]